MRLPSLALVVLTACSFDRGAVPASDGGFVDPHDDGGGMPQTWRTGSVEDWSAPGTTRDDAVVQPWGARGPAAWLTGGLLVKGSDDRLFSSTGGDVWPVLAGATPSGSAFSDGAPVNWGGTRPK